MNDVITCVTSFQKWENFFPPPPPPPTKKKERKRAFLGDFNSHSPSWGYPELDLRGEEIENWQIENRPLLLNHPDDQPTFYSRRWRSTTTSDLGFSTDDIEKSTSRTVLDQLAGSDHRPILIRMQLNMKRLSK